jgi:hypothetical protein
MLKINVNVIADSIYRQSSKSCSNSKIQPYLYDYHPSGNELIPLSAVIFYLPFIYWLENIKKSDW